MKEILKIPFQIEFEFSSVALLLLLLLLLSVVAVVAVVVDVVLQRGDDGLNIKDKKSNKAPSKAPILIIEKGLWRHLSPV